MYCPKCGRQIDNNSIFCPFCGQKADAGVSNAKPVASIDKAIGNQAKKWVIGVVAGLVAVTGVTVGAVNVFSDSDDKEPAIVRGEESEPVVAETPVEEPASIEEPVSEEPVDDSLHTVSTYEISNILQKFFQAHLGCYIDYCYGNCKTVPKNISSMSENIMGPVSTIELTRMVVPDYDDSLFFMEIGTADIYRETRRNDSVSYRCSVTIKDINIYDTFTYYEGTNAEIGVVAQLNYYVNDQLMDISNNYVACLLDNSTSNPDKWLIASAIFTNESAYEENKGNIFTGVLIDENLDSPVAEGIQNTEWKQKYLLELGNTGYRLEDINSYCLEDINGDSIPELWFECEPPYAYGLCYMKKDGTVKTLWGVGMYLGNRIRCVDDSGKRYDQNEIYEYDNSVGEYELILNASWETEDWTSFIYKIDGVQCSEEEYNSKLNSLVDYDNARKLWEGAILKSDKPLIEAISEY